MNKPTPSQLRACARWNWEKAQIANGQRRQKDHDRLLKQAISLGHQARDRETYDASVWEDITDLEAGGKASP